MFTIINIGQVVLEQILFKKTTTTIEAYEPFKVLIAQGKLRVDKCPRDTDL